MSDRVISLPEFCGIKSCPVGVHIAHYWVHDDGGFTCCDSDGNHDSVDSLPSAQEEKEAWRRYAEYCIETRTDPLCNYMVIKERKVEESWRMVWRKSLIGPLVNRIARGRRECKIEELPDHVREYLILGTKKNYRRICSCASNQEAYAILANEGARQGIWFRFKVAATIARPQHLIERDIVRAARKHLRNLGA